jgi:hypothetical protein
MPERDEVREGYTIEHPNREKAASKATKAIVVLLIVVSIVLMVIITIGGWDALEGGKPVQIAYIVLYVLFAVMITRWNRGLLPVTAALSIILLIFAAVSGGAWYDRDKPGFNSPALDEDIIGLLTYLLVPVQVLLIGFSMRGFSQAWNVEVERKVDDNAAASGSRTPQPA